MLLTIDVTSEKAPQLSYLLHKHPDRVQSFEMSFGTAHVFYPVVEQDRCVACLLLEVDPIAMVRGKNKDSSFLLEQYVNDRPFTASSFMSVALSQVFGSALAGRCRDIPELVAESFQLTATLDTLAVRVYNLASDERLAEASTAAVLIVLVGLLPVAALTRMMRRE